MRMTPPKARLYILLGVLLLCLPGAGTKLYPSQQGRLLVADGGMMANYFSGTVLYITHNDLFGTQAVVLNKPTTEEVSGKPLYAGGPIARENIVRYSFGGDDRYYAGYAGWAPLQMENEKMFGHWHGIDATPEILNAPPSQMWKRAITAVIRVKGSSMPEGVE